MTLALRMGRTLEELCNTMNSQEFSLWLAMYDDDQWGEARADLRAGVVASTVANYAGMQRAKNAGPAKAEDFFPNLAEEVEVTAPDPVAFFTSIAKTTTQGVSRAAT